MTNSTMIVLTSLFLVAIGALMVMNFAPKLDFQISAPAIPPLQIKGIAVVHKGIPFTLNLEQQKIVGNAIQKADAVKKSDYPAVKGPFNFEKVIIYRFDASDLTITPVQFKDKNLVFSAPDLNKDTYFVELSGGAVQTILESSHD